MKAMQRLFYLMLGSILIICMLTACKKDSQATGVENASKSEVQKEQTQTDIEPDEDDNNNETGSVTKESVENDIDQETTEHSNEEKNLIKDQTFETTLKPFGKVRFEAYEPDTKEELLADVTFAISQDGKIVSTLPGVYETNIRANEMFNAVEAVSFVDYNKDGYDDILIICSYSPSAGPDVGSGYSEIRIYSGNADGNFIYERELSENANGALAEKTIQSVKGFIGVDRADAENQESTDSLEDAGKTDQAGIAESEGKTEDAPWKQAYIDYLKNSKEADQWDGYVILYIDEDDIPEISEIGNCEAVGCKILNYSDNEVKETQLNRLYFSYIERENLLCNSEGNMDVYYDLVYSIIDGEMTLIAAGYYGAEDNSNVQFDKAGEPIYQYEWNGVSMDKEQYAKELNAVYDTSRAVAGYVWEEEPLYSLEEVIAAIEAIVSIP